MTTFKSMVNSTFVFVAGLLILSGSPALAARRDYARGNPDVIVVHPADLPAAAQIAGQAMYLSAPGSTQYLYIEQNGGQRLAVLDVTDPARTRAVAEIELGASRFEFVRGLDEKTVLVRFSGSAQTAFGILDLHHAKSPVLRPVAGVPQTNAAITLDGATLLFTNSHPSVANQASEYSGSLVSTKGSAQAIATIDGIRQEITDEETGRRFFLTANGLWIVRQPQVEREHVINEIAQQQP
jgi:hypothetical protein